MTDRASAKRIVEDLKSIRGRAGEHPEPPPELREALLREVPAELELGHEIAGSEAGSRRRTARWALAAAASLVVAVGAGLVAVRVLEERQAEPVFETPAEDRAERVAAGPAGLEPTEPTEIESEPEPLRHSLREPGKAGSAKARATAAPEPDPEAEEGAYPRDRRTVADPRPSEDSITVTSESPALGQSEREALRGAPEELLAQGPIVEHNREVSSQPVQAEPAPMRIAEPPKRKRVPVPGPARMPPSTGGTAEPNDRPYGDVFFRAYGTNPFVDTEDDPLSTFGLDVDTGSYGVVRRYLTDGHLPPPEAVRVEELVNAFDYGDPAPENGDFALLAEGSRAPFGPTGVAAERYHLVRFSIRARDVAAADRKSAVLTFVVDASGSMDYGSRLGLVKEALGLLLDELRPDDRVGLVVYGDRGRVVLPHTGDLGAIRRAVDGLRAEGSTNAEEGLVLGYELAREAFREDALNRVILCSDGVANAGATGPESILERIGEEARRGVELTTVGFGMGNYNDVLMEQLADRGDGAYAYVDTPAEARRVFVENLTGTLQTVARDARVQVAFDPEVVSRYRLLGYENRDVADERFRDDTVDAGEVGAGHTVTALYEVKLHPGARRRAEAATLTLRYESAETGEVEELSRSITAGQLRRGWDEASPSLRLAAVVAELAEILKGSYWAKDGDLDDLFRRAQALSAEHPGDLRVAELATLVGRAAALRKP